MLKVGEESLIKQHSAGAINPTSDSDDEQVSYAISKFPRSVDI